MMSGPFTEKAERVQCSHRTAMPSTNRVPLSPLDGFSSM